MGREDYNTKRCCEYMDNIGYPNLLKGTGLTAERNYYSWLDKRGKDVGIQMSFREIIIDEKFSSEDINRTKNFGGKWLSVRIPVIDGRLQREVYRNGLFTDSHERIDTHIWLFGIPYGSNIDHISFMEVYAVSRRQLHEYVTSHTGYSLDNIIDIADNMRENGINTRSIGANFRIGINKDRAYSIFIPYSVMEECGWHGWC